MRHHSLALIDLYNTAEAPRHEPEPASERLADMNAQTPVLAALPAQDANYDANRAMVGSFILILFGAMIGWLSHFMI